MNKLRILMLGESLDRQGGIVTVEKLIMKQAPAEIEISLITTLPNGSTTRKILVFFQALLILPWQLLKNKSDIVHTHVSERGSAFRQALTTMIVLLIRKPVILHSHSADFHVFFSSLPQIIKLGLSWIFCKSTKFIVLSNSWKEYYMKNLGLQEEQIIVLPNPVKIPIELPQRNNSQNINFLFLGRICKRKGAFDLIEAFAVIPPEQKQICKLIMAGDGDAEKAKFLIEKNNLSQYITILDWVDEQQRDKLLANADVFILPSYNEGLPMALLEAMSWGLPVITTPVGGIPELVINNENGLIVQAGAILDLSTAMQSLIKNEYMRLSLGSAARRSVLSFDVELYCIHLIQIYRSISTNL